MKLQFSTFFLGLLLLIVFASCTTQRMICPAYQSAFIYDEDILAQKFSYFEDSIPKEQFIASKDKFLVINDVPYRKKLRKMQTIEMVDVYPQEDSLVSEEFVGYGYDSTAVISIEVDSAAMDSLNMLPPWEEKFNIEQENYLYYFNDILVYPDERAALEAADAKMREIQGEKAKKRGFFKRLFGKKDKNSDPNSSLVGGDSTATDTGKKKGFFGRLFGKKNKNKLSEENQLEEEEEATEDFVEPVTDPDLVRPEMPEGFGQEDGKKKKSKKKKSKKPKKEKREKAPKEKKEKKKKEKKTKKNKNTDVQEPTVESAEDEDS